MKPQESRKKTETLVLGAILTALVVVLQFMGAFIRFGPFAISLVLIPIVIGAAICGVGVSTWLGFVFGIVVLISGDATAFLVVNAPGTIFTVLVKGMAAGFCAGIAYKAVLTMLDKRSKSKAEKMKTVGGMCDSCAEVAYSFISENNKYIAVLVAAIVCPLVNTGVFLIGCLMFFMETIASWTTAAGLGGDVVHYMIFVLVGANFLFEIASNIILSPVVVRLLNIKNK